MRSLSSLYEQLCQSPAVSLGKCLLDSRIFLAFRRMVFVRDFAMLSRGFFTRQIFSTVDDGGCLDVYWHNVTWNSILTSSKCVCMSIKFEFQLTFNQ